MVKSKRFINSLNCIWIIHFVILVYGVTNIDGSGYNRMGDGQDTKSKAGGAIINGEYRSQETKAST
jgi:hypothetical protein